MPPPPFILGQCPLPGVPTKLPNDQCPQTIGLTKSPSYGPEVSNQLIKPAYFNIGVQVFFSLYCQK